MKLDKISSIAEILSSIAVLITLVYLAVQTKQNTDAVIATSRQSAMLADIDWLNSAMDYPLDFAVADSTEMSPEDERVFYLQLVKWLRIREFVWFQHDLGLVDSDYLESYVAPARVLFVSERSRRAFRQYSGDPEFKRYLSGEVDGLEVLSP